jgi:hypothetical protein
MSSTDLNTLWKEALDKYKRDTKADLPEGLSTNLTADEILKAVEKTQGEFEGFRSKQQRIRSVLEPIASTLKLFSEVASNTAKLVRRIQAYRWRLRLAQLPSVLSSCRGYILWHSCIA